MKIFGYLLLVFGTLWGGFYIDSLTPTGWWGTLPLIYTCMFLIGYFLYLVVKGTT